MSSMVLSSPLSGLSHSKLIINSKNSSSPSKSLCIYFSNKNISLEFSSKSSFMHGDFTFPSPNLSTFVSKSQSSNIITAQTSPLGELVIYDFQAKVGHFKLVLYYVFSLLLTILVIYPAERNDDL